MKAEWREEKREERKRLGREKEKRGGEDDLGVVTWQSVSGPFFIFEKFV